MSRWSDFQGVNIAYLVGAYERYLGDPESVEPDFRKAFDKWGAPEAFAIPQVDIMPSGETGSNASVSAAIQIAQAVRWYGHFAAQIDPLGSKPPGDPALTLDFYGVDDSGLSRVPARLIGGVISENVNNAFEAITLLKRIYCSTVGYDFLQIRVPEERVWLRDAVESGRYFLPETDEIWLLERLTQVEVFEHFLQRSFPAKTRFSIEGLDILVPMLDELVVQAARSRIYHALLGMAHRGRLNVLAHILNMPYAEILAEFKDPLERRMRPEAPFGWTGDVKYHLGARHDLGESADVNLRITIAPNPSHLEAVNPVVIGMARAAGTTVNRPGQPKFNPEITLPILIHGDAAFPGQGVVSETFNLYNLPGYTTGGTIHIIANNQLGYTTLPQHSRSTIFASDLAKGFRAPIIHVNADDPAGCIAATRLAMAYRERFHKDFVIDLIGYRRLGHNEGDEPGFTQPRLYNQIQNHSSVRKILASRLIKESKIKQSLPQELIDRQYQVLQHTLDNLDSTTALREPPTLVSGCVEVECEPETALPLRELQAIQLDLIRLPHGFTVHPKLVKNRQKKVKAFEDVTWSSIDWAQAEELALASILADGTSIRMTGQDVERGTFSHRHAVLHDYHTGEIYTPLQSILNANAAFEIINSPLSEMAALGFEFGYNIEASDRLVIWEAQYGDFINGAQTIVDEFIVSARSKWNQTPSMILLLPHGYEGQGPDHSSARLERFLALTAGDNLRVANCTTAGQYFHLIRRQAKLLQSSPTPLIIMTPKSLLRHPLVASTPLQISEGRFRPFIEGKVIGEQQDVSKVVLCSGKIAIDLELYEHRIRHPEISIGRVEMLAPFPTREISTYLMTFPQLNEIIWVQEEPQNMGAWEFVRDYLHEIAADRYSIRLIGRPRSASPAEGSAAMHTYFQRSILQRVFASDKE